MVYPAYQHAYPISCKISLAFKHKAPCRCIVPPISITRTPLEYLCVGIKKIINSTHVITNLRVFVEIEGLLIT